MNNGGGVTTHSHMCTCGQDGLLPRRPPAHRNRSERSAQWTTSSWTSQLSEGILNTPKAHITRSKTKQKRAQLPGSCLLRRTLSGWMEPSRLKCNCRRHKCSSVVHSVKRTAQMGQLPKLPRGNLPDSDRESSCPSSRCSRPSFVPEMILQSPSSDQRWSEAELIKPTWAHQRTDRGASKSHGWWCSKRGKRIHDSCLMQRRTIAPHNLIPNQPLIMGHWTEGLAARLHAAAASSADLQTRACQQPAPVRRNIETPVRIQMHLQECTSVIVHTSQDSLSHDTCGRMTLCVYNSIGCDTAASALSSNEKNFTANSLQCVEVSC